MVDAGAVRCPTLVVGAVVGADPDRITPTTLHRRIVARCHARHQQPTGHAHVLMLEAGWERPFKDRALDER